MNIALFGFMGVGKSEVGRILASRLGLVFADLDEEVVGRTGKTIAAIFEGEGEAAFRELEREITAELSSRDGQVIACGGGTVLNRENLRDLRRGSLMILLTADPETILKRVEGDGGARPLLKTSEKLERIRALLTDRRGAYLEAADLVVDTSGSTPEQAASDILDHMKDVMGA